MAEGDPKAPKARRSPEPEKPLMRSLGEFFGHIWKGVASDPTKPKRHTVREVVEEETRDTPQGKVVIRRTTIEEVELPPEPPKA